MVGKNQIQPPVIVKISPGHIQAVSVSLRRPGDTSEVSASVVEVEHGAAGLIVVGLSDGDGEIEIAVSVHIS